MHCNLPCAVFSLLDKSADVNATDSDGDTPLHNLFWYTKSGKLSEGHVKIAKALLDKGADVLIKNENGNNALDAMYQNHNNPGNEYTNQIHDLLLEAYDKACAVKETSYGSSPLLV